MSDKNKDSKVKGIGSSKQSKEIERLRSVEDIKEIEKAKTVEAIKGAIGISGVRTTRSISPSEREHIFKMIQEEAEKLFPDGSIMSAKKEMIKSAVKMAIEAGILDEEDLKK
jgi:hypothetical protein